MDDKFRPCLSVPFDPFVKFSASIPRASPLALQSVFTRVQYLQRLHQVTGAVSVFQTISNHLPQLIALTRVSDGDTRDSINQILCEGFFHAEHMGEFEKFLEENPSTKRHKKNKKAAIDVAGWFSNLKQLSDIEPQHTSEFICAVFPEMMSSYGKHCRKRKMEELDLYRGRISLFICLAEVVVKGQAPGPIQIKFLDRILSSVSNLRLYHRNMDPESVHFNYFSDLLSFTIDSLLVIDSIASSRIIIALLEIDHLIVEARLTAIWRVISKYQLSVLKSSLVSTYLRLHEINTLLKSFFVARVSTPLPIAWESVPTLQLASVWDVFANAHGSAPMDAWVTMLCEFANSIRLTEHIVYPLLERSQDMMANIIGPYVQDLHRHNLSSDVLASALPYLKMYASVGDFIKRTREWTGYTDNTELANYFLEAGIDTLTLEDLVKSCNSALGPDHSFKVISENVHRRLQELHAFGWCESTTKEARALSRIWFGSTHSCSKANLGVEYALKSIQFLSHFGSTVQLESLVKDVYFRNHAPTCSLTPIIDELLQSMQFYELLRIREVTQKLFEDNLTTSIDPSLSQRLLEYICSFPKGYFHLTSNVLSSLKQTSPDNLLSTLMRVSGKAPQGFLMEVLSEDLLLLLVSTESHEDLAILLYRAISTRNTNEVDMHDSVVNACLTHAITPDCVLRSLFVCAAILEASNLTSAHGMRPCIILTANRANELLHTTMITRTDNPLLVSLYLRLAGAMLVTLSRFAAPGYQSCGSESLINPALLLNNLQEYIDISTTLLSTGTEYPTGVLKFVQSVNSVLPVFSTFGHSVELKLCAVVVATISGMKYDQQESQDSYGSLMEASSEVFECLLDNLVEVDSVAVLRSISHTISHSHKLNEAKLTMLKSSMTAFIVNLCRISSHAAPLVLETFSEVLKRSSVLHMTPRKLAPILQTVSSLASQVTEFKSSNSGFLLITVLLNALKYRSLEVYSTIAVYIGALHHVTEYVLSKNDEQSTIEYLCRILHEISQERHKSVFSKYIPLIVCDLVRKLESHSMVHSSRRTFVQGIHQLLDGCSSSEYVL